MMYAEETKEQAPVTQSQVLEPENLQRAWKAVKSNKGTAGVDGKSISQTQTHIKANWASIAEKIATGSYKPGAVRSVTIPKTVGTRTLGIPNVQDRLIQQAIHQQINKRSEQTFSDHSYGFRPNRSAPDAVRKAQSYVTKGKVWVVDLDLKSFFDEVNHDLQMRELLPYTKDKLLRTLIGKYLRAPMQDATGKQTKRQKGTPQGSPLSPLLANIYLDPLDKELERRKLSFVRYADDIAIYLNSRRSAERVLQRITKWIEKHLRIPVNLDKSGAGISDESAFLGFRLRSDGKIGISPKSIKRLKEKVRDLWDGRQSLTSNELRDQWQSYILGWWNYFKLADHRWGVEDLSGWIRRHIRKCFWLRWKTPIGRKNALYRLGVRGRRLWLGYTGLGAWRVARLWTLQQSLNNKRLTKFGFIIPWT